MIIDCHTHVASPRVLPDEFFAGWASNIAASAPGVAQEGPIGDLLRRVNDDSLGDRQVAQMDQAGIDRSVLLIIDFKYAYGDAFEDLFDLYLAHHRVRERHPGRYVVFAGVDPRRGPKGVELFERSLVELKFGGLKIYPPCGFSPSDPRLFEYYEVCRDYRVPVLTHVGPTTPSLAFRYSQPYAVDEAAQLFPDLKFILGHGGATHLDDTAALAQYRPNVFLDLSGFQPVAKRKGLGRLIAWHRARGTLRKLVFGTDWPIHRFQGNQAEWTRAFAELKAEGVVSDAEYADIMGGNLLRLNAENPRFA